MKPKSAPAARGRPPKAKVIKQELEEKANVQDFAAAGYQDSQNARPSVEIVSCISYQKFRYSGENRPGKKYQEKDFMELKLLNLGEKVVRVVIICTDAENKELIHPNGLVGKDCHDGIYDKEYPITNQSHLIKIPYLRTERIKTKKNELAKIRNILKSRAQHLPSPYRERCESQCTDQYTFNRKFDTTKVCLGVIVTVRSHYNGAVNGSLHAISHVVNNASEKTALGILKLSNNMFSPAKGGLVDIFTTEDGPAIEYDKYYLYVTYEKGDTILWSSERVSPAKGDILYKRIVTYSVPPFHFNPDIEEPVEVILHLDCPQSNQSCECSIVYTPLEFQMLYDTNPKRSFTEELEDIKPPKRMKLNDTQNSNVKTVLKESLKRREDDRKTLVPAVEIVQRFDNGALVRRTDTHTVPDAMEQDIYSENRSSPSPYSQNDQQFQVLCADISKSVASDTVVIIANNDEEIENAINKAYFDNQSVNIDLSSKSVVVSDSKPAEQETHLTAKQQSEEISRYTLDPEKQELKSPNPSSSPPITLKKNHKTDSPWAVGSDDESDEALHIFNELSSSKQSGNFEKHQKKFDNTEKITLIGGQKSISVLSDNFGTVSKLFNSKEMETSREGIDFSGITLPSQMNLNSDFISNFDIVKNLKTTDFSQHNDEVRN